MDKKLSKEGLLFILGKIDEQHLKENEASIVVDIQLAADAVNNWVVIDLSQPQFDAITSLTFNIGVDAFKRSSLLKLLNKGLIEEAMEEFDKWVYLVGRKLPELVTRRYEERELFAHGERLTA